MFEKRFLQFFACFVLLAAFSFAAISSDKPGEISMVRAESNEGLGEDAKGEGEPEKASTDNPGKAGDLTKSYAFYVGKNLTADGSTLLGGTGEEPSSHWLEIQPRQQHAPDETVEVGVTKDADIPGKLTEIPQAEETYKYISMDYSEYAGFPAPLTNGGMNEYQVAGRDIWSPSREELVEMTPEPQKGPQYSDLARIAMERATTAREAAEIVGEQIDKHGFSTYGGNTHMFADPNEGWIVKEMAGGKGLWVAERLGPDEVRVAYPGYIEDVPQDYQENPDYMGSDNLVSFATEQGWYSLDSGEPFNVHEIYGDGEDLETGPKLMAPKEIEGELDDLAPVTLDEMMAMVRDPRISDEDAGYGQVAHLRSNLPNNELATLWVAPTGSVTAPFIPWRIGVQGVPPEFRQHRYLTKGADAAYLNKAYMLQEATDFAGRTFKQLMYYTCAHPATFLPEVNAELETFEAGMLPEQAAVEARALELYQSGQEEQAREYLTDYSNTQALEGLQLGENLVDNIGARTQELYGIPEPPEDASMNAVEDNDQQEVANTIDCLVGDVDADVAGDLQKRPEAGLMSSRSLPDTGGMVPHSKK
jgi:dipeptidase